MFNFKRLSKQQQKALFDQLMEEGWKTRGYVSGNRAVGNNHCALGVVEAALGIRGEAYVEAVFPALKKNRVNWKIAIASNEAGSKEKAIKAVKAIQW